VKKEWGLEVFKRTSGYFVYGYSRPRFPQKGDVLVFCYEKQLIGSVPVVNSWGRVDQDYERKKSWKDDWKYAVGLDFDEKKEFIPPIPVEEISESLRALRGKQGKDLHNSCRVAPEISSEEYLLLLQMVTPKIEIAVSATLSPLERSEFLADLSPSLKRRNASPSKVLQAALIYKRNQKVKKALKKEYEGICQICGIDNMIEMDSGKFYSEGHHLIPLGEKGSDDLTNVVILCPLCHRKLHYSKDREDLKQEILYSDQHMEILKEFERQNREEGEE
jgi:hypothetical protein